MYSAKKVGGKKLYEMARRGEVIEREPVRICIHELEAIKPDGQLVKDNLDGTFDFHVRVVCSAGTYVRALAEDSVSVCPLAHTWRNCAVRVSVILVSRMP